MAFKKNKSKLYCKTVNTVWNTRHDMHDLCLFSASKSAHSIGASATLTQ